MSLQVGEQVICIEMQSPAFAQRGRIIEIIDIPDPLQGGSTYKARVIQDNGTLTIMPLSSYVIENKINNYKLKIKEIFVYSNYVFKHKSIKINKSSHLILIGRNGCGKTTILQELFKGISGKEPLSIILKHKNNNAIKNKNDIDQILHGQACVEPIFVDDPRIAWASLARQSSLIIYLPTFRSFNTKITDGPRKLPQTAENYSEIWMQYLINQEFQRLRLLTSNNPADRRNAKKIEVMFRSFEKAISSMVDTEIDLVFDEKNLIFNFLNKKQIIHLHTLPDGWSSLLKIWSEIQMNIIFFEEKNPTIESNGIVLIDEIDAHLHIELQQKIFGILISLFPNFQFIVSTHSPVILSSAIDTIIYDMNKHVSYDSKELKGHLYGDIMKHIFDLAADYDLETFNKFNRWKQLFAKISPSPEDLPEEAIEMIKLENEISKNSRYLTLQIWHIRELGGTPLP